MPPPGDGDVKRIGIGRLAEEILLKPVPLPSTPPEGNLWRWLQAMVAREAGDADVVLSRYANIQIEDHAGALEKLRKRAPEHFTRTIQLDAAFSGQPVDYRLMADHAKLKAVQIARREQAWFGCFKPHLCRHGCGRERTGKEYQTYTPHFWSQAHVRFM